jgi:predicted transcriptional regulator
MVSEFVDRVFDGASRPLLLHLVRSGRLSDKERAELLRLIKREEGE